jgi:fatty acid desaturase
VVAVRVDLLDHLVQQRHPDSLAVLVVVIPHAVQAVSLEMRRVITPQERQQEVVLQLLIMAAAVAVATLCLALVVTAAMRTVAAQAPLEPMQLGTVAVAVGLVLVTLQVALAETGLAATSSLRSLSKHETLGFN